MARLIVSMLVSADGRYEGPGGDLSVLPFDEGFDRHNLWLLESAGALLAGRRTFEQFVQYWPSVADDPDQPEVQRAISAIDNRLPKHVISDTLTSEDAGPWRDTTTIVARADALDAVRALRAADGGDIVTFGSATAWNPLLAAGLVDELQVLVGPAVAGGGPSLYEGLPVKLDLAGVDRLEDSQLTRLRFTPAVG